MKKLQLDQLNISSFKTSPESLKIKGGRQTARPDGTANFDCCQDISVQGESICWLCGPGGLVSDKDACTAEVGCNTAGGGPC
ncbi:MAG: hypothetical protein WBH03_10210 [Cyclobacteriaceae bacterium]